MLGLTISNNLFMMYIFWELVGFASYLLIGFWFTKESAVQANKKAFIINRIGDLGFLLGIASVYSIYGSLNLVELFGKEGLVSTLPQASAGWMTFTGICFFCWCNGKVGSISLACLATRRDGRSHCSFLFNPCCYHGCCRSVLNKHRISSFQ
jgi:NADH-quinone oxidoreductase subunit L